MDPSPPEIDSLASYLDPFLTLAGDLRTVGVLAGTVPGIVDSGSAVWRRISTRHPRPGGCPGRRDADPPDAAWEDDHARAPGTGPVGGDVAGARVSAAAGRDQTVYGLRRL